MMYTVQSFKYRGRMLLYICMQSFLILKKINLILMNKISITLTVLTMLIDQYFSSNDEIDTESYLTAFTCSAELTFVGQC